MGDPGMSSPSKQKGTAEETAIVNDWNSYLSHGARRMPAGARYDVHVDGHTAAPIDVLSTRADRGERLVTLRFHDFMRLHALCVAPAPELHIESKRYARFSLHTIFESKFGKRK